MIDTLVVSNLEIHQTHRTFHICVSLNFFCKVKGTCISLFWQLVPSDTRRPYLETVLEGGHFTASPEIIKCFHLCQPGGET